MVEMFVRHAVTDFAKWKAAYDEFDAERTGMGVTGQAVFQSTDDPNDVTAYHDFADLAAAQGFMGSPRIEEVMEAAGVAGAPTIWFTNPAYSPAVDPESEPKEAAVTAASSHSIE